MNIKSLIILFLVLIVVSVQGNHGDRHNYYERKKHEYKQVPIRQGGPGNSACAHFCQEVMPPGEEGLRGACVSAAAHNEPGNLCTQCQADATQICPLPTNLMQLRCCQQGLQSCCGSQECCDKIAEQFCCGTNAEATCCNRGQNCCLQENRCVTCRSDQVFNPTTCQCNCPSLQEECGNQCRPVCGQNEVRDPTTCECRCAQGFERCQGQCRPVCGQNEVRDPTTCECRCAQGFERCQGQCRPLCGQNEVRDPTTCACLTVGTICPTQSGGCSFAVCPTFPPVGLFRCHCFPSTQQGPPCVCARNAFCTNLQSCTTPGNCPPGSICSPNTGCGQQGVCLTICTPSSVRVSFNSDIESPTDDHGQTAANITIEESNT